MTDPLNVYIPTDRRHALARGEALPDRAEGAVLIADISGFTPLTEALGRMLGRRRGAEELTRQLNSVYDALIAVVDRFGGSVISFSGDAITCWFDGDPGRRATACALMMHRAMGEIGNITLPSGGIVSIGMKAAIAHGPVRRFVVGDPAIQLIDVLAGATLERMEAIEHLTHRSELVIGPECLPAVKDDALIVEWRTLTGGSGETLLCPVVGGLLKPVETAPWPALEAGALTEEQVRPWLLRDVYDRLQSGQGAYLAELRSAVAFFLRFSGIDYDGDPAAGEKLDAFLHWVQGEIHRHEGFLLQVTIGDKGSYLYAAFGAPVAHDDDPARAVAVSQILRTPPVRLGFITSVQIGLTQGRMRTGPYGGNTRRTYGVLGDEVNLAARLMQAAAPGQVIASQPIAEATAYAFAWESLTPISVKGKAEPVAIHQLAAKIARPRARTTGILLLSKSMGGAARRESGLVGRNAERAVLTDVVLGLTHRESATVILEGEAGIGKTRLIDELRQEAAVLGLQALSGIGNAIERAAYHVWREAFYELLDWEKLPDESARQERLLAAIGPERAQLAPLLNESLRVSFSPNSLTQNLTGKPLADSTRELLLHLLHDAASREPLIVILEDAHWMDSASWTLASTVHQRARNVPLLLVIATRPITEPPAEYNHLLAAPDVKLLRLQPLAAHDVLAMICQRLGVSQLPEGVAALIRTRAEGNPFFSEELSYALRDAGLIEIRQGQCRVAAGVDLDALALPDTVQGVITSRIDRLSPPHQLTLKVASAIGREFVFRILSAIHPVEADKPQLPTYLDTLERLELTLHELEPELMYLFKHTITQDVAYNLMLFAQRRELHRVIGEWYEREYADRLPQVYPLLAHHWSRAAEGAQLTAPALVTKAVDYLTKAGEQASQISAFREAIAAYERALALTPPTTARNGGEPGGANRAALLVRLGNTYEAMGDFASATDRLQEALSLARAAHDVRVAAEALTGLCWVATRQGKAAEARSLGEEALARAREAGDKATMALALRRLGVVVVSKSDPSAAIRYYEESLALYHEIGDKKGITVCLNNMGNVAAGQNDYAAATRYYQEALAMARETGDRQTIGALLGNLGVIARRQNDYAAAAGHIEEALGIFREIGARELSATTVMNLGKVTAARGDKPTALRHFGEALNEAMLIGALPLALSALTGVAGAWVGMTEALTRRAAELMGLVLNHPASTASIKQEAEPVLAALRAALPADEVEVALTRGAGLEFEGVVNGILREDAESSTQ